MTGLLCAARRRARSADAVAGLAASPLRRERLAAAARAAVAERTWDRALQRLADGYRAAAAGCRSPPARRRAGVPPELRLVRPRQLRIVDVALFYGERSGGIRTYLDAKRAVLAADPGADHHVIVPGPQERHDDGWHALPSLRLAAANGYRVPIGVGALKRTLKALSADVVLLHDPFWSVMGVNVVAREGGARVIAVHHTSPAMDAHGLPGPTRAWQPLLRGWFHHAYREVDAVMAADDPWADTGRVATLPLRFGVDEAFRPRPEIARGDHVLYAGRLAREKGIDLLLDAAARSRSPWKLELIGDGPASRAWPSARAAWASPRACGSTPTSPRPRCWRVASARPDAS